MKAFLKEIKFPSTVHTYFSDITSEINESIKKAKVKEGFVFVNSKHTTLGIVSKFPTWESSWAATPSNSNLSSFSRIPVVKATANLLIFGEN